MRKAMCSALLLCAMLIMVPAGFAKQSKLHENLRAADGDNVRVIVELIDSNGVGALARNGCKTHYAAKHADLIVADCPADALLALSEDSDVAFVGEDEVFQAIDATSRVQVKADQAYDRYGTDGSFVKVAVIDTGVNDSSVGALLVYAEADFTEEGTTEDRNGHGTAVASVLASTESPHLGVAPGVRLLNAKAGDANADFVSSDVIEAIDWSIAQGARVISMSLGAPTTSCASSMLASYVNSASVNNNTLFVIGAGNSGPGQSTIYSPGCAERALTVGAVDSGNNLASFSSRGPTNDGRVKPDVVAPGVQVQTANRDGTWSARDGTSFATPHVAGVAAMMLNMRESLFWDELKGMIKSSAVALPGYSENEVGAGLVDAIQAVNQTTTWPTYANFSTSYAYPAAPVRNQVFDFNWSGLNTGNTPATGTSVSISWSSNFLVLVSGADPSSIGDVAARATGKTGWQLKGKKAGTYPVTVTATAGNTQRTDVINVVVV